MRDLPHYDTAATGEADARLALALARYGAEPTLPALAALHGALAEATVYVPVVATATATVDAPGGLRAEAETDMALVTLVATDGRSALPMFSGLDAMAAWRSDVRPVAVSTREACASALAEGHDTVVLDVAGTRLVLTDAEISAHAQGYLPVVGDDRVASRTLPGGLELGALEPVPPALAAALPALRAALAAHELVAAAWLLAARVESGREALPLLGLALARDADASELAQLGSVLAPALGSDAAAAMDLMVLDGTTAAIATEVGLRLR